MGMQSTVLGSKVKKHCQASLIAIEVWLVATNWTMYTREVDHIWHCISIEKKLLCRELGNLLIDWSVPLVSKDKISTKKSEVKMIQSKIKVQHDTFFKGPVVAAMVCVGAKYNPHVCGMGCPTECVTLMMIFLKYCICKKESVLSTLGALPGSLFCILLKKIRSI